MKNHKVQQQEFEDNSYKMLEISWTNIKEQIRGMKWYYWVILFLFFSYAIACITIQYVGAAQPPIDHESLPKINEYIQQIINTTYDSSWPNEYKTAYEQLQDLLKQSFNIDFSDPSIYNEFAKKYHEGINKPVVDNLVLLLSKFDKGFYDVDIYSTILQLKVDVDVLGYFKYPILPEDWIPLYSTGWFVIIVVVLTCFFFPFNYDTGMVTAMNASLFAYKNFLKDKKRVEKQKFIYSPMFFWIIDFTLALIGCSFGLSYGIHRLTSNDNDIVFSNWYTWEVIPSVVIGGIGLFFYLLYPQLMAYKRDYVEVINNVDYDTLYMMISDVNMKCLVLPWFREAEANCRVVITPNELRKKLKLKTSTSSRKSPKRKNDRF